MMTRSTRRGLVQARRANVVSGEGLGIAVHRLDDLQPVVVGVRVGAERRVALAFARDQVREGVLRRIIERLASSATRSS